MNLTLLFLFGGLLLFLWMFFATEAFTSGAQALTEAGRMSAEDAELIERYGEAWRHGMEGGWPLYMPGFFLLSVAIVAWCRDQSTGRLVGEAATALSAATIFGLVLAPAGADSLGSAFEIRTGSAWASMPYDLTPHSVGKGLLTAAAWTLLVVLLVKAIRHRNALLLIPALAPQIALYFMRSGDSEALFADWAVRLSRGDPVAILSLAMIPVMIAGVVWVVGRRSVASPAPTGAD